MPPGTTEHQPVVARRREVLKGSGQVDVSIWGSGFHRCDDRLSPVREAGRGCSQAFFSESRAFAGHPRPWVINVDRNPAYPQATSELKRTGALGRRCRWQAIRYLNNIVEQDHRAVKRWLRACQGFRSFHAAWRNLQGIETMNMIRKGQDRWIAKNGIAGSLCSSKTSLV